MSEKPTNCSLEKVTPEQTSLLLDMMHDFYAIDGYPFDRTRARSTLEEFIAHPEYGTIWFIHKAGIPIGYAILCIGFTFEFGGRDAFIDELYIIADYRNKGYGQQTIDMIVDYAESLKLVALHLEVELHNEKGKALYKKKGFKGKKSTLLSRPLHH